jgi:ribosomal protein L24
MRASRIIQILVIFVIVVAYMGIATYYFNHERKNASEQENVLKQKVIQLRVEYEKLESLAITLKENPQKYNDPLILKAVDIDPTKVTVMKQPPNNDNRYNIKAESSHEVAKEPTKPGEYCSTL